MSGKTQSFLKDYWICGVVFLFIIEYWLWFLFYDLNFWALVALF